MATTGDPPAAFGPRGPRRRPSYNESVDEPAKMIEDEPVEIEEERPQEDNQPVEEIDEKRPDPPAFTE